MSNDLPPMPEDDDGVGDLVDVDPSPIDEPPEGFKDDYFPSTSPPPPSYASRTSTLGLGNHGPAYYRESPLVI